MADVQVTAIIKEMDQFVEGLVQKLNLDITARLQQDTPIQTGWARANWVPSIGRSFQGTAGTRLAAEAGNIDLSLQSKGLADLASRYRLNLGDIFITNNVPYITKLNEGTSKQAPRNFVGIAIERAIVANGGKA